MRRIPEERIEEEASRLREKLNMKRLLHLDMDLVLKGLPTIAPRFSFRPALADEMGDDEARMNDDTHTLIVRDSVLEDAKAGRVRARFTIAHELGHYFLGHEGERRRNPEKTVYAGANERIQEKEADLFASYFLVPTELAWNMRCAEDISASFQVSGEAADYAFERVQAQKRRATGQKRRPPDSVIDFLKEAQKRGHKLRSDISEFE